MKKAVSILLIALFCFSVCCGKKAEIWKKSGKILDEIPSGTIEICRRRSDGSCFLLFKERVYEDPMEPPEYINTFCLYDRESGSLTGLHRQKGLLYSSYTQASAADEALYFGNGTEVYKLCRENDGWSLSQFDLPDDTYGCVSPGGELCAVRYEDTMEMISAESGKKLADLKDCGNVGAMNWSEKGNYIAMVYNGGNAAAIWKEGENSAFRYFADGETVQPYAEPMWRTSLKAGIRMWQTDALMDDGYALEEIEKLSPDEIDRILTRYLNDEEKERYESGKRIHDAPAPDGWVEISDVHATDDGAYFIVTYLCETETVHVIWETYGNCCVSEIHTAGDSAILDVSGNMVLYETKLNSNLSHQLHICDCAKNTDRLIAESRGFFTSACILSDNEVLACIYDTSAKESSLKVLPLSVN